MSAIKRSMSVRPTPIDTDTPYPERPSDADRRWSPWDQYSPRRWTGPWGYVVTRVTNSTAYRPGWLLTKAKVDALIEEGWTVSVLSKV